MLLTHRKLRATRHEHGAGTRSLAQAHIFFPETVALQLGRRLPAAYSMGRPRSHTPSITENLHQPPLRCDLNLGLSLKAVKFGFEVIERVVRSPFLLLARSA